MNVGVKTVLTKPHLGLKTVLAAASEEFSVIHPFLKVRLLPERFVRAISYCGCQNKFEMSR